MNGKLQTRPSTWRCLPVSAILIIAACKPSPDTTSMPSIVDVCEDGPANGTTDIVTAVRTATSGATINIQEGVYTVKNPVLINADGISLIGAGADKTVIRPLKPSRPVFQIDAAGITIKGMTIDALVDKGPGRATFAIHLDDNGNYCKIFDNRILNSGAAAIIGYKADGCTLAGNTIVNSGEDAVRLRGNQITAVDNSIVRYFDEALDLAGGSNIVVIGNHISEGRIGIVVDDCRKTTVSNNHVKHQLLEGIVVGADPDSVVTGNTVLNSGSYAYNLYSPGMVYANHAGGTHKAGFRLHNINNSHVIRNSSQHNEKGFDIQGTSSVPDHLSEAYMAHDSIGSELGLDSVLFVYGNCTHDKASGPNTECQPNAYKNSPSEHLNNTLSQEHIKQPWPLPVKTNGNTQHDESLANSIAALFTYYNPGVLSISVDEGSMRSVITSNLFDILEDSRELGVGLVRAPFLHFNGGNYDYTWHLEVADSRKVALVTPIHDGPRVRVTIMHNGKMSAADSLGLLKDKLMMKFFN